MKWLFRFGLFLVLVLVAGLIYWKWGIRLLGPKGSEGELVLSYLEKYDFDSLRKRGGVVGPIELGDEPEGVNLRRKKTASEMDFESRVFYFYSEGKKISGMMNNPKPYESRKRPAIIMIRGYADKPGYYVGSGSWRMADELAKAGFATFSVDFLGFGESDQESFDMMEARFEKVSTVLDLIESVRAMGMIDKERVGIWAHSNGGQIALSVLAITGKNYPTSLWAPMTNPFPKSVLDTASGLSDGGKTVMSAIENFEKFHDSRRYAFENYYHWIGAPVVIHQGSADPWCQVSWQEEVVEGLRGAGKEAVLHVYPNDDHNLSKNWEMVVGRDIDFFGGELAD